MSFKMRTFARIDAHTEFYVFLAMALLMIFMLAGCSTVEPARLQITDETTLHLSQPISVNGKKINGYGWAPVADHYQVVAFLNEKIDRVVWRTCAQEQYTDKPSTGWLNKNVSFVLKHSELEKETACGGVDIEVFTAKKQKAALAFFDIRGGRQEMALGALLECNGQSNREVGVGVCDSARGLIQQITFNQPVVQRGVSGTCDVMRPLNGNEAVYRFAIPGGRCTYYFVAQEKAPNGKRNTFRLTTNGYTDLPIIE